MKVVYLQNCVFIIIGENKSICGNRLGTLHIHMFFVLDMIDSVI